MKALAVLLLVLFSTEVCAEWTRVQSSDEFDVYADLATTRNGNTVKMWVLREYGVAHRVEGKAFLSAMIQEEYDCREAQSRLLFISFHARPTGAGDAVTTIARPTEWRPVVPGTVGRALWNVACGK